MNESTCWICAHNLGEAPIVHAACAPRAKASEERCYSCGAVNIGPGDRCRGCVQADYDGD